MVSLVCFILLKIFNEILYTFTKILVPTMVFLRFYKVFCGFGGFQEGEGEQEEEEEEEEGEVEEEGEEEEENHLIHSEK